MKKKLSFILCYCLIIFSSYQLKAQQYADSTFDTSVKLPAYSQSIHPKILFDEAHFNFHTANGRYKPFAAILRNDGYVIIPNKQVITSKVLKGYDIFITVNALGAPADSSMEMKCRNVFVDSECQALREWVLEGGALLLVADHQPAGNAVDNLGKVFGIDMGKCYTSDPKNYDKVTLDPTQIIFSEQNHNLGVSPILMGRDTSERIRKLISFTGQSLKGPKGYVPLLLLSDEAFDVIDFYDFNKARTVSAKGRCQALTMKFGKGRVVVFGEAAMLTAQNQNFGMNYPGIDNKQLVLNIAHWLSALL